MKQRFKLMLGDNMESLKKLPDNSIDSVVVDPPYGLGKERDMNIILKDWIEKGYSEIDGKGFMGKEWDAYVPQPIFWKEIFRVLKPGGHILAFFGTRTYDIGTMAIRLAGFEIRDQIQWIYGSGFPKSHNIGKAVDKLEGNEREVVGTLADINPRYNTPRKGGDKYGDGFGESEVAPPLTKGTSPYEGWGTALKPANEPICVARKPLSEKSVAENVIKWGTGGINIDGCRVGTTDTYNYKNGPQGNSFSVGKEPDGKRTEPVEMNSEGRFPANIILECICDEVIKGEKDEKVYIKSNGTGAEIYGGGRGIPGCDSYGYKNGKGDTHTDPNCPCRLLDEQSGDSKSSKGLMKSAQSGNDDGRYNWNNGDKNDFESVRGHNDKGGASRFFYQAKVSKAERNMGLDGFEDKKKWLKGGGGSGISDRESVVAKNSHPTVKPINLMSYLCRLITPEGGIVLDPFMGSGSTGVAAQLEGFRFVGMEMDKDYFKIAESRIDSYEKYNKFKK